MAGPIRLRPQNPGIIRRWRGRVGAGHPFFDFPPEVRRVIYTTNMIENIHRQLSALDSNRGHFPSEDALHQTPLPRLQGRWAAPPRKAKVDDQPITGKSRSTNSTSGLLHG